MKEQNLAELVIKAQNGDKNAMNDLVGACYNDIYYYVLKTVKKEDMAADVTQESFLEIITTIGKLREPEAFPLWARRIAYHKCALHFRNSKEVLLEEDEDGETLFDRLPDESEDALPEQVLEDQEFRKTIMDMINSLPSEQTNALLLYYYEKLSVGEIAEIQGTTAGTVKSRLNYARKAIKGKVEEYEKKTGTKLHSIAILPLLLRFLFESEASARPILSVPAPLLASAGTSAAGGAAGATAATAATVAAKTVAVPLAVKIVGGVVAASIAIGSTVYGISRLTNKADETDGISGIQESASEPQYIEVGNQSVWSEPESGSVPEESGIGDESEPSVPPEVSGTGDESEPSVPPEVSGTGDESEPSDTSTEVSGSGDESEPSVPPEVSGTGNGSESSVPPEAEPDEKPSEGLEFKLNGGGSSYSVVGIGSCTDTKIVIPAKYNGLPVTEIGQDAFMSQTGFSGIVIPNSVTAIGNQAFRECADLTNITIPDGVTQIGNKAFYDCKNLTGVTVPDSVTSMGDYTFFSCTSLSNVTISKKVTSIGMNVFCGCTSLTSIALPDSVTSLQGNTFSDCLNLANITLPDSLTSIGMSVFSGCTSLTSITLPRSLNSIGMYAFRACTNLTNITISNRLTSIGANAFQSCTSLTDITFKGSKAEWESITKGRSWDSATPAYTVHCTNGDITKS